MNTEKVKQYLPIPKVFVPVLTALVALAVKVTASGQFNRAEAAYLVGVIGYALIAYFVPGAQQPVTNVVVEQPKQPTT